MMSFGIQMCYSQTRLLRMIMEDGNRLVSNSISFWKLLKELNDDPEEIFDLKKSLMQECNCC